MTIFQLFSVSSFVSLLVLGSSVDACEVENLRSAFEIERFATDIDTVALGEIALRDEGAQTERILWPLLYSAAALARAEPNYVILLAAHGAADDSRNLEHTPGVPRIQSIVAFLVRNGIEASRIETTFYGEAYACARSEGQQYETFIRRVTVALTRRVEPQ